MKSTYALALALLSVAFVMDTEAGKWPKVTKKASTQLCPDGQAFVGASSYYDEEYEDRVVYFACGDVGVAEYSLCISTEEVNDLNGPIWYTCPTNMLLTGAKSVYSDKKEDRQWSFTCCGTEGFVTRGQTDSDTFEKLEEDFDFTTPAGYYINGPISFYHKKHEDRDWKFSIARFEVEN